MDTVAQRFADISKQLDDAQIKYVVSTTCPTIKAPKLDQDCTYIIRQRLDDVGVYHLVVAARMGQEKSHGI